MGIFDKQRWRWGFVESAVSDDFYHFVKREFGLRPRNSHWYRQALNHASLGEELAKGERTNERLEFLGDSVIGAVAADWVFTRFPNDEEGPLTRKKSNMVSRKTLNRMAKSMGLQDHVRSKFKKESVPDNVIGNAFEALVGALFLDHGFDKTKRAVSSAFARYGLENVLMQSLDYKSLLHHWAQVENKSVEYRLVEFSDRDSMENQGFRISLLIDGEEWAVGEGTSKKSAEQAAAQIALDKGDW